jgi:hypothetical protein
MGRNKEGGLTKTIMAKYRKKPVIVEAMQWDGSREFTPVKAWVESLGDVWEHHFFTKGTFRVLTLEGESYELQAKDFIIRGIQGEYYPCKPDIFYQTYERVE